MTSSSCRKGDRNRDTGPSCGGKMKAIARRSGSPGKGEECTSGAGRLEKAGFNCRRCSMTRVCIRMNANEIKYTICPSKLSSFLLYLKLNSLPTVDHRFYFFPSRLRLFPFRRWSTILQECKTRKDEAFASPRPASPYRGTGRSTPGASNGPSYWTLRKSFPPLLLTLSCQRTVSVYAPPQPHPVFTRRHSCGIDPMTLARR